MVVKHNAPCSNKAINSSKVTVKVTRSSTLVSSRVCMPNIKSLSLMDQKLYQMLKLTTDRQTARHDYILMGEGHGGIKNNLKMNFYFVQNFWNSCISPLWDINTRNSILKCCMKWKFNIMKWKLISNPTCISILFVKGERIITENLC